MKPKKSTVATFNIEKDVKPQQLSLSDYPKEIQPILSFLKENQLPVVIMVNVVNNNQSIGDITQSTVYGCNINGDYNSIDGTNTGVAVGNDANSSDISVN